MEDALFAAISHFAGAHTWASARRGLAQSPIFAFYKAHRGPPGAPTSASPRPTLTVTAAPRIPPLQYCDHNFGVRGDGQVGFLERFLRPD
jgi:hypothetical protein